MNSRFHSNEDLNEELLADMIREAGDPTVSPDPKYMEMLRAEVLDRLDATTASEMPPKSCRASEVSASKRERGPQIKRLAQLAVAATVLLALATIFWNAGGFGTIAFADVAKAVQNVTTATYDFRSEVTNATDGKQTIIHSKGFFQAPSLERVEMSMTIGTAKAQTQSIMILDSLAAKGISLMPEQKKAQLINIVTGEESTGGTSHMFDLVQRLVDQESTSVDKKVQPLGKKEIDGNPAIGFRTQNNMGEMTLWADPQTARLVRVEIERSGNGGRAVLSNFRYDMEFDSSLFSFEPPPGYTVERTTVKRPVEEDLVRLLRLVAKHNAGSFPDAVELNDKTILSALEMETKAASEKLLNSPTTKESKAKLRAQYGDDKAGFDKAWMEEWVKLVTPITQRHTQKYLNGVMFYMTLQPEQDSHYAGKSIKLGTPDCPIFWYKPKGSDKYRAIYADLSIHAKTSEDVKNWLPEETVEK